MPRQLGLPAVRDRNSLSNRQLGQAEYRNSWRSDKRQFTTLSQETDSLRRWNQRYPPREIEPLGPLRQRTRAARLPILHATPA